jgi:hypothetical protein
MVFCTPAIAYSHPRSDSSDVLFVIANGPSVNDTNLGNAGSQPDF